MADYKVEHLTPLQRKAKFDEMMKTHSGWVDKLRKNASTNNYMKKVGKCSDIVVTGYLQNQSHALKQQVTLEAISEIKKAFWFPKQVHVYCDDDDLSRGYIAQKTNTVYEAHVGLGKSSINYVRAAAGADAQYYRDYKYGGPWDGASWRLFADTVYESTRGDEQKKKKARLKAAVLHEIGHILWQMNEATDYYMFQQNLEFVKPVEKWVDLAKNVSYSATVNLNEFAAEFFSAFWSGERFTTETVELYNAIGGPFPDTFSLLKEIKPGIGSLSKPSI